METKKLNFAVIGAGRFAKNHIRVIQESRDANLIGVSSRTKEGLGKIRDLVPKGVQLTTDASKIIKDRNTDCVLIVTPPSTHFEIAKAAINAGKHVLLEKPMAANLKEADELRKIVQKQNKVFMVAHQYVYNDYINYLKSNIRDLGEVNFAYGEHLYPGPMRSDIGCLWDAGTHVLSIVQHLFNPGNIRKVAGKSMDILGNKLDDFTSCTAEFENGLKVLINVSWVYPEKSRRFIVFGDKSTDVFDDVSQDGKLKYYKAIPQAKQLGYVYSDDFKKMKSRPLKQEINAKDTLSNQLAHFIDCINYGKQPLTNIEKSHEITRWLDKISRGIKLPSYK